jgi:cell division protease FtsH
MTVSELKGKLATLLGGRAAEVIVFSEASTGAHNDLIKTTDIARRMVKEYGMSESIGLVTFDRGPSGYLGIEMEAPPDYSDDTSREIDNEVKRMVDDAYKTAQTILKREVKRLHAVAKRLLEVEVLEGDELRALLDGRVVAQ